MAVRPEDRESVPGDSGTLVGIMALPVGPTGVKPERRVLSIRDGISSLKPVPIEPVKDAGLQGPPWMLREAVCSVESSTVCDRGYVQFRPRLVHRLHRPATRSHLAFEAEQFWQAFCREEAYREFFMARSESPCSCKAHFKVRVDEWKPVGVVGAERSSDEGAGVEELCA
jgi:hypothetical protein